MAATVPASAKLVTRSVDYSDQGVQLQGYLAYDDARAANGKVPGVLVVPEWWGVNDYVRGRAEKLAALGYVAFVVDMYGKGVITTDAKKASELAGKFYGSPLMASRARAGLDQILATGLVDPARVAAIGYCFGGSTVQALAYTGAPLAGIVSFHGGLIPVPSGAAAKTKARFLVCQGAADPFVPQKDRDAFLQAMDAGKFDYQYILYSGAVHAFSNPEADKLAAANGLQGKIGYSASADRSSWAQMQVFFGEIFAR
ncbi:MAG TPA: dienelactone hydrolase family protein [Opitutaceae bacterium]|nr:dienelactone hydrolase family protein [Opitutaceae bacterium]